MVIRRPGHRAKIGQPPHIRSIELHRIDIRDHPALIESPPNDPLPIRRKKWPAIITGGSGGIGRACASAFAKAGANVVIASLPPDSIPPVVQEVEALGVEGLGLATDVSNAEQVKSMAELPEAVLADGSDWVPAHLLHCPLRGPTGVALGGMLFFRAQPLLPEALRCGRRK